MFQLMRGAEYHLWVHLDSHSQDAQNPGRISAHHAKQSHVVAECLGQAQGKRILSRLAIKVAFQILSKNKGNLVKIHKDVYPRLIFSSGS